LWQPKIGREAQGIALTMAKAFLEASRTIVEACGPPWARRRFGGRGEEIGVLLLCILAAAIPAAVAFYLFF
jgi:hypothetical protein